MKTEHPSTPSQTVRPLGFCLSMLFVLCCASNVVAQLPAASPQDLEKVTKFRPLFDERQRLIDEIAKLDNDIAVLTAKLNANPSREDLEADVKRWEKELADEQKKPSPNKEAVESIRSYIVGLKEKIETADSRPQLERMIAESDEKRRRFSQLEQKIAALSDDKQDENFFRAISVGAFSALVAVVVGGFYLIAWFKDGIAAKIFSGEMGMQFVTLFLIVIAIILFGIMGTLEGRELAALLGGLSGYILGKASAKTGGDGSDSNSGGQNQQQQNQQQQNQQQENPG